ncbi:hypothetical protein, partial [Alkalibacterium thalassium]|uniref:hypothetical protein n=1 Tax=Alkalibacterium thalassium TaxID=426701 RepID=UPI001C40B409
NFKIKRRQTKQALISMYALIPRLKPWAFTLDSSVMKTGALPSPKPLITMTIVNSTVETDEIIRMKRIRQKI